MSENPFQMRKLIIFLLVLTMQPWEKAAAEIQPASYDSLKLIVSDKALLFSEKYEAVSNSGDYLDRDQYIDILKRLVCVANKEDEKREALNIYGLILRQAAHFDLLSDQEALRYVDTVLMFSRYAEDLAGKAEANVSVGTYYQARGRFHQSSKYMLEALSLYEQSGKDEIMQHDILYTLGAMYLDQEDTLNLSKVVAKMKPLTDKIADVPAEVYFGTIAQSYYVLKYDKNPEEQILDSILLYGQRAIGAYESVDNPPPSYGYQVAYNYIVQAEYMMKEKQPLQEVAKGYLEKALEIAYPDDISLNLNYHKVNALRMLALGDYNMAEKEAALILELLSNLDGKEDMYGSYESAYKVLANVYQARGDFKNAYEYEKQKAHYRNLTFDSDRQSIIQDMQAKYEADKKDYEIEQLSRENIYQTRIKYLIAGIALLLFVSAFLAVIWLRNKRKTAYAERDSARLKQQDAELRTELEVLKREEKETEYKSLLSETRQKQMRSYLDGLESERIRLARELHDNISNGLIAAKIRIESGKYQKNELLESIHQLHIQIRNISHEMMPPVLKLASLPDIISDYVRQQNELKRANITFKTDNDIDWQGLSNEFSLEIYRIIQEAVTNSLKYAEADKIAVLFHYEENSIRLTISDNGKGFDIKDVHKGIGLRNISERVNLLNGNLSINSYLGEGTIIEIII